MERRIRDYNGLAWGRGGMVVMRGEMGKVLKGNAEFLLSTTKSNHPIHGIFEKIQILRQKNERNPGDKVQ